MMNSEARKRMEENSNGTVEVSVSEALNQVIAGLRGMSEVLEVILNHLKGLSDESDQEK
jgi:hypothetical protein